MQSQRRYIANSNNAENVLQDGATPESGEFSIDGFQNYTSAEIFIQGLAGLVNQSDVETMIRAQKQMLQRFEKTNEMLLNCNVLSQSRLKTATEDFKKHVKLLTEMKRDLDYVFRKIRVIKQKLKQQYPVAYASAQPQRSSLAEEAEDELGAGAASVGASSKSVKNAETQPTTAKVATQPLPPGSSVQLRTAPVKNAEVPIKRSTTVEYVQMEEAIENGKPIENELIKRVCSIETANPNDSSDCTSEDTG